MRFHPIKYQQPVFGDSRCALYSIANLLGDNGILLYSDVGKMTHHNSETRFLRDFSKLFDNGPLSVICNIHPFAIAPRYLRFWYDDNFKEFFPDADGAYVLVLVDHIREGADHNHTIGVLWGRDEYCIAIDPQKNEAQVIEKAAMFELLHVTGFRPLCSDDVVSGEYLSVPEFAPDELPHIFDIHETRANCVEQPHTASGVDFNYGNRFPNIRHEVQYIATND